MSGTADTRTIPALVTTEWLATHLSEPHIKPVDASWYLPQMNRDPKAEFEAAHIPGAVFFDIDAVSDTKSPYPHTLPAPDDFAEAAGKLGLSNEDHIIVYDTAGLMSAPRVWWMFKTMGHEKVSVLNGGFKKWQAEHRHVKAGRPEKKAKCFTASLRKENLRTLDEMRGLLESGKAQILDARSKGRFEGTAPEPRPGLASGHMPGSLNLPFDALATPEGTVKPKSELKALFKDAGLALEKPVVTTCGSGVTAAALYLALTHLGKDDLALYDGSWAEWAAQPDAPIETG